jgi:hypothetical protein
MKNMDNTNKSSELSLKVHNRGNAMNVRAIEARYNIKVQSCKPVIRSLKARVRTFEKRYEIPTATMLADVHAGKMRETTEISQWMQYHAVLGRLTSAKTQKTRR